jgi:hypothetical protein
MLIGEKDTLLTGVLGYKTSGKDDPMNVNIPDSERVVTVEETINDPIFLKTPRYPLYGISGLYYNYFSFCRFLTKNFMVVKNKLSL